MTNKNNYQADSIKVLKGLEAVRKRPGMYIGDTEDGTGLHHMVYEVVDNSIDEYVMGYGKTIDIKVNDSRAVIRDYGRGIPIGKLVDCVSKINTGGKYDSKAFQKSVGLNGVGTKAVNALSEDFIVESFRDNKMVSLKFKKGILLSKSDISSSNEKNGTIGGYLLQQ